MKPNCMQCMHFYITYDQKTPKGCKVYGIQSQQLPSLVIKQATANQDCLGFALKERLKEKKHKDLNDPKLW